MTKIEVEISEEELIRLKKLANKDHPTVDSDDPENSYFDVYSFCGGNVDDAYELGERHESILNARYILNLLNIKWN